MSAVIFCGPSLPHAVCERLYPEATIADPAACGDVYRAWRRGADAIGVIDGYFDQRLAVWHKEILWVLKQGVPVYGAASMGALRAAELSEFGMIGLGFVFEQFRSGELEDDDEVAVVHEPKQQGFRLRSEAMVNIRVTLADATRQGIVSRETSEIVLAVSKREFYADRVYPRIFELAHAAGAPASELENLQLHLREHGPVHQKSLDAELLLRTMRRELSGSIPVSQHHFRFNDTDAWQALRVSLDRELQASEQSKSPTGALWSAALERTVALLLGRLGGITVTSEQSQRASEIFRQRRGLVSEAATHAWLEQQGLSIQSFSELMYDEALIAQMREQALALVRSQLASALYVGPGISLDDDH